MGQKTPWGIDSSILELYGLAVKRRKRIAKPGNFSVVDRE
jgi:hypothetical protein